MIFKSKDEELTYYRDKAKKQSERSTRMRVRDNLLKEKARAAGITVSDEEISKEMKRLGY